MKKLLILFTIIISACAHQEPIRLKSNFDANQAKNMLEKGKLTLTGEAFLRRIDGSIVTCAGEKVSLIPETSYALERMFHIYGSTGQGYRSAREFQTSPISFSPNNTDYNVYIKKVMCDSQGHFKFSNLKSGKYIVVAPVTWGPIGKSIFYEGGNLMQQVDVIEDNQHVILSK